MIKLESEGIKVEDRFAISVEGTDNGATTSFKISISGKGLPEQLMRAYLLLGQRLSEMLASKDVIRTEEVSAE